MAITFISASTADNAADDDVVVSAPASIQDDDLLIGFYHCYGDATTTALPVSLSGFTQIDETFNQGGTDVSTALFYKVASSESGSYTFTGSHTGTPEAGAHMIVLRGVDTSDPLDVTFVNGSHYVKDQNHGVSGPTAQPITTESDGAWVVLCCHTSGIALTSYTAPTNYTERTEIVNVSRNGTVATREIASFTTETPGNFTATGASGTVDSALYTIAIKAAGNVGLPSFHGANRGIMRGVARGVG